MRYLPILILCFLGCRDINRNTSFINSPLPNDSLVFDINDRDYSLKNCYNLKYSNTFFALVKNHTKLIQFNGNKIQNLITIPSLLGNIIDFFPITPDSIYFITDAFEISRIDIKGRILQKHIIQGISPKYLGTFYEFPFEVSYPFAFFYQYPNIPINSNENLSKYLSSCLETIFNLKEEKVENANYACFPIQLKQNNYYVFNPIRCIDDKSNIIYSFPCFDTIYVFNYLTKTEKKVHLESNNFITNTSFDLKKISNFNYISKYLTENSRFSIILYDKYRHLYYSVLSHKYNYENKSEGTINKWIDKPWSLIVLNEHFSIIHEVTFPPRKYNFTKIIITAKSILIADYISTLIEDKQKIKFYAFNNL